MRDISDIWVRRKGSFHLFKTFGFVLDTGLGVPDST